nr:MAG TPA: hypothetical protein [Caudoviricetes sp.]
MYDIMLIYEIYFFILVIDIWPKDSFLNTLSIKFWLAEF